jgi:hypothetical protein
MKRLVPFALAGLLVACAGCHHSAKKKAPTDTKYVASDTERDFMKRWIDKRTAELVTKGMDPQAAHQQAVGDYKTTFAYTRTVGQAQ